MSFEQQLQNWMILDNELKKMNEKIKLIREQRNQIANVLINNVQSKRLDNFSMVLGDEKIKFLSTNTAQPITFKYIESCLKEIIKNESQVTNIIKYIKAKREIKQEIEIKRFNK
jgi:hypothetical protein